MQHQYLDTHNIIAIIEIKANALTYLVCPYKVAMHLNGDLDCHILVVLSQLPLTICELGNMANEVTLKLCPIKVVIKLYGDSDCHIPILPFELPLTIFEFGNVANAYT